MASSCHSRVVLKLSRETRSLIKAVQDIESACVESNHSGVLNQMNVLLEQQLESIKSLTSVIKQLRSGMALQASVASVASVIIPWSPKMKCGEQISESSTSRQSTKSRKKVRRATRSQRRRNRNKVAVEDVKIVASDRKKASCERPKPSCRSSLTSTQFDTNAKKINLPCSRTAPVSTLKPAPLYPAGSKAASRGSSRSRTKFTVLASYFTSLQGRVESLRADYKKDNQDRVIVEPIHPHCSLIAVFDGHGEYGHVVSEYVKERVRKTAEESVLRLIEMDNVEAVAWMKSLYSSISDELNTLHVARHSGCTATVGLVLPRRVVMAWVGDSKAALYIHQAHRFVLENVTEDHCPGSEQEWLRISKCGASVSKTFLPSLLKDIYRIDECGLAMSRAMGDKQAMAWGVISEPEVEIFWLSPVSNNIIILATDGVWDVISPETAVSFLNKENLSATEPEFLAGALERVLTSVCYNAWEQRLEADERADDATIAGLVIGRENRSC